MNYIITKHPEFFKGIGNYQFTKLENMELPEMVAVDTETTGLKPITDDIFAIQIGTGTHNYLIHCYDDNYTPQDVLPYLKGKILVGQNIAFDLGFFYKYGFFPDNIRDTFIASKILHNGVKSARHDFGTLMERELSISYDKSEQQNINKIKLSTDRAIQYCFNDVDRLMELYDVLVNQIIKGGYYPTYELHCEYLKAMVYMEYCGAPLSAEKWKAKIKEDIRVLAETEEKVKQYIYKHIPKYREKQLDLFSVEERVSVQLSSPKQMIGIFKELGVNVLNDDFKESIAEDILKKSSHEFIPIWLDYQSAKHDVTTFGENILEKTINGRIYSSFNPILDTARISTKKGDVNTLNLPANQRTRACVEATPGFKIIVSDYDGQETRVGADITGDEAMIDSIVNKADLHCAFARVLYPELEGLTDAEIIKDHKAKRNKSKSPRFCFQFGGTGYTLALNEGLPVSEGMRIEGLFKSLHKGIYAYGDKKIKEAVDLGYIESTAGFKLHLPYFEEFQALYQKVNRFSREDWTRYKNGKLEFKRREEAAKNKVVVPNPEYPALDQRVDEVAFQFFQANKGYISKYFKLKSKYFRLCLNNPTQTTAAHQTKRAACKLFDFIKENGHIDRAKICIIPHDEFVLEVEDELVPLYVEKLGYFMREAGNEFIISDIIRMEADAHAGNNWYEAK